jgi:hypothetical protein
VRERRARQFMGGIAGTPSVVCSSEQDLPVIARTPADFLKLVEALTITNLMPEVAPALSLLFQVVQQPQSRQPSPSETPQPSPAAPGNTSIPPQVLFDWISSSVQRIDANTNNAGRLHWVRRRFGVSIQLVQQDLLRIKEYPNGQSGRLPSFCAALWA